MKNKKLKRVLYRPDCYAMLPERGVIEVACLWMSESGDCSTEYGDYALVYSPPKRGDSCISGCGSLSVVKRSQKKNDAENLYVDVDGENWSNIGDGGYVCPDLLAILKKINKEKTAETILISGGRDDENKKRLRK